MVRDRPQFGAAASFIDTKLADGFNSFSLEELVKQTGLSVVAARNQLLRLGDSVARVSPRQQYFLIVTPEKRAFGGPPVEWWLDDFMQWLGRPYYVALQSAAAIHGSSPQAIQEVQVITDTPRRALTVGRMRVHFFMKTGAERTIIQQLTSAHAPMAVSTPESTAFDLIRYAQSLGGIERMAETIAPMAPVMKPKALRLVLAVESELATSQRLGFVLDAIGGARASELAQVVRSWLPSSLRGVLLSFPAQVAERMDRADRDAAAPVNQRWGIINNARSFA